MMANYVNRGHNLDYKNETGDLIPAGDVVVIEDLVGVAAADIPDGEIGAVATHGVFKVPFDKAGAVNVGATLYWNAAGKTAGTAAGGKQMGFCALAAGATDETIAVKLMG